MSKISAFKTEEELLDFVIENKCYSGYNVEELKMAESLVQQGLLVRLDTIPHLPVLNKSYTYVTNDDIGRAIALDPKYTLGYRHLF